MRRGGACELNAANHQGAFLFSLRELQVCLSTSSTSVLAHNKSAKSSLCLCRRGNCSSNYTGSTTVCVSSPLYANGEKRRLFKGSLANVSASSRTDEILMSCCKTSHKRRRRWRRAELSK